MNDAVRLIDEAYRQRHFAIAVSRGGAVQLEKEGAYWIVRVDAWHELRREEKVHRSGILTHTPKRLIDLPVRITFDDEPDAPELQLVMPPAFYVRPEANLPSRELSNRPV